MSLSHIFIRSFIKGAGNASGGIFLLFTSWQIIKFFTIQKKIESDIENILDYEVHDNRSFKELFDKLI